MGSLNFAIFPVLSFFFLLIAINCEARQILQAAASQPTGPKLVFAHYMMGNSYPQDVPDFKKNIDTAMGAGVDGFALNVGPDEWMPDRVAKMYKAAIGTSFKLFISLDMDVLANSGISDLLHWVNDYASHPNQYFYSDKQFVSTFAGQLVTFGMDSVDAGWNAFKSACASAGHPIFFVPSFFLDPSTVMGMSANDGAFNWNAWPTDNAEMTTTADMAYMNARNGKVYMAGVSPWFFTHFKSKNRIFKSDDLWTTRWEQVVSFQPDFIEIITWNDYGESSYVGTLDAAFPSDESISSQAWSEGYDHIAWLDLASYYIKAYKNGANPPVTQNKLYWWYRTHPKDAVATSDPYGRPENYEFADDNIFLTVMLTGDADITVTSGDKPQTFKGKGGVNHFQYQGFSTGTPSVTVQMNGATVVNAQGPRAIESSPKIYNFNAVVASVSF